jgi:hypothetical protein
MFSEDWKSRDMESEFARLRELALDVLELQDRAGDRREYLSMFPGTKAYLGIWRSPGSQGIVVRNSIVVDGGGKHIDPHLDHCRPEL